MNKHSFYDYFTLFTVAYVLAGAVRYGTEGNTAAALGWLVAALGIASTWHLRRQIEQLKEKLNEH